MSQDATPSEAPAPSGPIFEERPTEFVVKDGFVLGAQKDQLRRYNEIKQTEMPMAEAAKKTREFRCPPHEQVRVLPPFLAAARAGACFVDAE